MVTTKEREQKRRSKKAVFRPTVAERLDEAKLRPREDSLSELESFPEIRLLTSRQRLTKKEEVPFGHTVTCPEISPIAHLLGIMCMTATGGHIDHISIPSWYPVDSSLIYCQHDN